MTGAAGTEGDSLARAVADRVGGEPGKASITEPAAAADALLEREAELARLRTLLDSAAAGSGSVGIVEGDPGIGKTRILSALRTTAADREFTVLSARGSKLERDFAFGVVRQLFEPTLALVGAHGREELFAGAAAFAAPVFAPVSVGDSAIDPGYGVLHGLFWFCSNVAERGPLVLIVDDLQWSDTASLRFLLFLANRIEDLAMTLLVGMRPMGAGELAPVEEEALHAIRLLPVAASVEPAALSPAAVASILARELGAAVPPGIRDAAHKATGGNPFLVGEIAREIATEEQAGRRIVPERIAKTVPARISASIVARVSRIDSGEALARAVAILGDGVETQMAARLAEIDGAAADGTTAELARAGILAARRPLRFRHPIVRSAIYESIPPHARAIAHGRAAEILAEAGASREEVAIQLLHSAPVADPETAGALREAAAEAVRRGAPEVALDFLERAMQEPPPAEDLARILFEAGSAARMAGDPSAIDKLERALSEAEDPALRAEIASILGETLSIGGRDADAVGILVKGVRAAEEAGLAEAAARLRGVLLVLANALAETRDAVRGELAAAIERVDADPAKADPVLLAHAAIEHAVVIGPAERAVELGRRALEGGVIQIVTADAPPVYLATGALWVSGSITQAERWLTAAFDEAGTRGSAVGYALASAFRSAAKWRAGDLAGAVSDAQAGMELGVSEGWTPVGVPIAAASLISALVARGDLEGAAGLVRGLGQAEIPPGLILYQHLRLALADLELAREQPIEALGLLDEIAEWETGWGGATGAWCWWRQRAARAHAALGDPGRARELAREELALARKFGAAPYLGASLRVAGELAAGPEDPLEQLREGVAVLADSDARLEHAMALASYGSALRRGGADRDSRGPLEEARALARACGARTIEQAALDELVAAGARPRPATSSEAEKLTPAELRVAKLAAEGKSNREIAQALFVTLKTVETHLGRTYRKLEISSRAQLPGRLAKAADDARVGS